MADVDGNVTKTIAFIKVYKQRLEVLHGGSNVKKEICALPIHTIRTG